MAEKVWLVWRGEYSDHHVEAVCASEAEAADLAEALDGSVEGWEVGAPPRDRIGWTVFMNREGLATFVSCEGFTSYDLETPYTGFKYRTENSVDGLRDVDVLIATVRAESREHAVKVVNERRVAILAAEAWGRPEMCEKMFQWWGTGK